MAAEGKCSYAPMADFVSPTDAGAKAPEFTKDINDSTRVFWKSNCAKLIAAVKFLEKSVPKYNKYINALGAYAGWDGYTGRPGFTKVDSDMYSKIEEYGNTVAEKEFPWYKNQWVYPPGGETIKYKPDGFDLKKEMEQARNIWSPALLEHEKALGGYYDPAHPDIQKDSLFWLYLEPYLWAQIKKKEYTRSANLYGGGGHGTVTDMYAGYKGDNLASIKVWVKMADKAHTLMKEMKVHAHNIYQIELKWRDHLGEWAGRATRGSMNESFVGQIKELFNSDVRARVKNAGIILDRLAAGAGANIYAGEFDQLLYREQCYLLARVFELSQYKRDFLEARRISLGYAEIEKTKDEEKKAQGKQAVTAWAKPIPYLSWPGTNCSLLAQGDPYSFITKLTQYTTKEVFFDATEELLSSLVPQIRLFKIITDYKGEESQKEFVFDTHTTKNDLERMMQNKNKRGFGVGIKDINVTYAGTNFFSAQKDIKGSVTIVANSFDELMIDRGGYRYIDLALKTGKPLQVSKLSQRARQRLTEQLKVTQTEIAQENNDLNFRLKALIGWALPTGNVPSMSGTQKGKLLGALNNAFVTINLTPTIHTFNIDDNGKVEFKVEFLAYVDHFFDSPHFNIFASQTNLKNLLTRKLMYDYNKKKCAPKDPEQQKEIDNQIRRDKIVGMQTIVCRLRNLKKIYYINIDNEGLKSFISEGPYAKYPSISRTITDSGNVRALQADIANLYRSLSTDDEVAAEALFAAAVVHPENENLAFCYASDLIDAIMYLIDVTLMTHDAVIDAAVTIGDMKLEKAQLKERYKSVSEKYKRFRLVLGPVEIVNPKTGAESSFVNLGDLPVSIKYFNEWLTKKVLAKGESQYNLTKFLTEFFNDLISTFMNDDSCFKANGKQKVLLNQTVLTSYKDKPDSKLRKFMKTNEASMRGVAPDEISALVHRQRSELLGVKRRASPRLYLEDPALKRPVLNISGPTGPIVDAGVQLETNYLIFYASRTMPTEFLNGNRMQDHSRGIYHYVAGRRSGIVKTIKLQRTNTKSGYKEARFEQNGFDGLQQLREVYDVNIDCYADVLVFPGTYIFVDPKGWAPNMSFNLRAEGFDLDDLTDYGLGGYYMVTRAEHDFGPGRANTKITAKWVASVEKGFLPGAGTTESHQGGPTQGLCGKKSKQDRAASARGITAGDFHKIMKSQRIKADTVQGPPKD